MCLGSVCLGSVDREQSLYQFKGGGYAAARRAGTATPAG